MELGVSTHSSGRFTVITVEGEIDLSTAPALQAVFDALDPCSRDVVLDFRK